MPCFFLRLQSNYYCLLTRLELQYAGALERSQIIKDELISERQTSEELRIQLEEFMNRDERNMEDIDSLQVHIQQQEAIIRELEEREQFYSDQLGLLDVGVKISNWWKTWSWLVSPQEEMEDEQFAQKLAEADSAEAKNLLKDRLANVTALQASFEAKEAEFSERLQNLQEEFDSFVDEIVNILCSDERESEDRREEVMAKVRMLLRNEGCLKKQISDLEKKESAYSKTIQEADTIMARVEYSYQERIKELEQEKHDLKERIRAHEESLKSAGKVDEQTVKTLNDRLAETERSEALLRERIAALESCEEDLRAKLAERELANAKIKSELRDQNELVKRICDMDTENQELTLEIGRLQEVEKKLHELKRTEELLRKRLAELEESESSLKISLDSSDREMKEERQRYSEAITSLKREISSRKSSVTEVLAEADALQPKDEELKRQVHSLRLHIKDLESEVKARSEELESIEDGYRSEVSTAPQRSFLRYRSMRDHTGRFFLLVKIR